MIQNFLRKESPIQVSFTSLIDLAHNTEIQIT